MKNKNGLGVVFRKTICQNSGVTLLTGILVAACVAAALLPPLVLEKIVNQLTGRQAVSLVLPVGYFGLLALSDLLESGQNVMITVFGQKMTHNLRSELCAKLKRLPASYFTQHGHGGNRITSEVRDLPTPGTLTGKGMLATESVKQMPEVPLVTDEYPEFSKYLPWGSFYGVFVKEGTDQAVVDKLSQAFTAAFNDPTYQDVLANYNINLMGYTGDLAKEYLSNWQANTITALTEAKAIS